MEPSGSVFFALGNIFSCNLCNKFFVGLFDGKRRIAIKAVARPIYRIPMKKYFTNDLIYNAFYGIINASLNHYYARQDFSVSAHKFTYKTLATMLGYYKLTKVIKEWFILIHVCFSLHDKTGAYSKFTGTAMLSIFENISNNTLNPSPVVTVHILHDNTLTDDNREKLFLIANRYGQLLKFYNVEELCADKLAEIKDYFLNEKNPRFSIAMFYRLFVPQLIIPRNTKKVIYFDADIIINLDISELWQIDMEDHPLAAVPEFANDISGSRFWLVRDGLIKEEDYFNSGVLLMNLKVLRNEENAIFSGVKFRAENPKHGFFDQTVLNYCFAARALKLPVKFNRFVKQIRSNEHLEVKREIYHYTGGKELGLNMDMNDPFNYLWMSYFIRTPWFGADIVSTLIGTHTPFQKNYAISVVIPLHNEEKYIGECLNSLLLQTFQDFEIIVVDDCSTDSSCEIVESYTFRFDGRLKLYHLRNDSDTVASRTKGINLSSGEYVFLLEASDILKNIALERMYSLAKNYDADVVYCEKYSSIDEDGSNIQLRRSIKGALVKEPTFDPQDLKERVDKVTKNQYSGVPWLNFVRRSLMIENEIFFQQICSNEDNVWMYALVFYAKKFLRVPDSLYVHRDLDATHISRPPQEAINIRLNALINGIKTLDKLLERHEFFKENPSYHYTLLKNFVDNEINSYLSITQKIADDEVYLAIKDGFRNELGDYDILIPALCTTLYNERKFNANYGRAINKFKKFLTVRIDVIFMSTAGDFQIISTSDENAEVAKPEWLQKKGIGYKIQSYAGNLSFLAKATADGKIDFVFRSMDVRDPEDKSKHIPYWIDYTKLTINGKMIFDKPTPVWHDEPYRYKLDVKAGEEIKVQVEWLPHRSDAIEPKIVTPSKVVVPEAKVTTPPKVTTPESKVTTPPKVTASESKIVTPSKESNTARIDIKLMSTEGDFKILSVSDKKVSVRKPEWFQKNGIGYQIESYIGKIEIVAKSAIDGQINLILRGIDMRDPEDKYRRIPYWIDYTKLNVNGKVIFNNLKPIWHDKPYYYNLDTKAGEEIKIQVEWQPHKSDN